jgi:hypothetical protein
MARDRDNDYEQSEEKRDAHFVHSALSFRQRPQPDAQRGADDERNRARPHRHIKAPDSNIDMAQHSPQVPETNQSEDNRREAQRGAG